MKLKLTLLILVLQSAWILGTVISQENVLRAGKVVLLETQPVDPRDPLRGDYIRLNYRISDIPHAKFSPPVPGELRSGTKIFVALTAVGTNGFWDVSRASTHPLVLAENEVLLRGKSLWTWRNLTNSIHIEYGIERYYVAEGTGNPRGKLTVQAAVSASGRASIKEVFVDGVSYAEAMKKAGQ